jgi:hypothetical protein
MKRLLQLLLVVVLLVAGVGALGYYRGWFTVSTQGDDEINLKLDKEKLKEDEDRAKAKLEELKGKIKDKVDENKKDVAPKPSRDGQN